MDLCCVDFLAECKSLAAILVQKNRMAIENGSNRNVHNFFPVSVNRGFRAWQLWHYPRHGNCRKIYNAIFRQPWLFGRGRESSLEDIDGFKSKYSGTS